MKRAGCSLVRVPLAKTGPERSAFRAKNLFKVADATGRFLDSGLAQEALQGFFLPAFSALLIAPQEPDKRPDGQRESGKTKGDPPAFHDLNVLSKAAVYEGSACLPLGGSVGNPIRKNQVLRDAPGRGRGAAGASRIPPRLDPV